MLNQVVKVGLVQLEDAGSLAFGSSRCELFRGSGSGVKWLGWSTNLQSSFGVTSGFKADLASWVGANYAASTQASGST